MAKDAMVVDLRSVASYLEGIARARHPLYYMDVTEHFALPKPNSNWRNHVLCKLFEQLDLDDAEAKRPFRTSMVIRKDKKRPGIGFFVSLAKRRGVPLPSSEMEMKHVYWRERDACIEYYGGGQ